MISQIVLSMLAISLSCQAQGPLVVHLNPPSIKPVVTAYCDRPLRWSGVNVSLVREQDTRIVHCYGHGGFGYSTLFGSVQEAIALLEQESLDLATPIRIIGSGCMGLTMAIELARKGFTRITISTKEKYNIPSWRAGAYFLPAVGNESAQDRHRLQLSLATYGVLRDIEAGLHPYLTADVLRRLPIYFPAEFDSEVQKMDQLGLTSASESVTLDFGNGVVHEGYSKQHTYLIDVTTFMTQLWAQVEQLHIPVAYEEIKTFVECDESVVFNCTGAGGAQLNADDEMIAIRGHFCMLAHEEGVPLRDYMICTYVMQHGKKEAIYFFPKPSFRYADNHHVESAGMIGATYIPVDATTSADVNEYEYKKMIERAITFFHGN